VAISDIRELGTILSVWAHPDDEAYLCGGTMAMDAGVLKSGQVMKAYFCMIFEFSDGKIHRIRNYDCFEPLG